MSSIDGNDKLTWVQRNGPAPSASLSMAELMKPLMENVERSSRWNDSIQPVVEALKEITDEDFRRYCRLGNVTGDEVHIHVSRQELITPMRLAWSSGLKRLFQRRCPKSSIRRIEFRFGQTGLNPWREDQREDHEID